MEPAFSVLFFIPATAKKKYWDKLSRKWFSFSFLCFFVCLRVYGVYRGKRGSLYHYNICCIQFFLFIWKVLASDYPKNRVFILRYYLKKKRKGTNPASVCRAWIVRLPRTYCCYQKNMKKKKRIIQSDKDAQRTATHATGDFGTRCINPKWKKNKRQYAQCLWMCIALECVADASTIKNSNCNMPVLLTTDVDHRNTILAYRGSSVVIRNYVAVFARSKYGSWVKWPESTSKGRFPIWKQRE